MIVNGRELIRIVMIFMNAELLKSPFGALSFFGYKFPSDSSFIIQNFLCDMSSINNFQWLESYEKRDKQKGLALGEMRGKFLTMLLFRIYEVLREKFVFGEIGIEVRKIKGLHLWEENVET